VFSPYTLAPWDEGKVSNDAGVVVTPNPFAAVSLELVPRYNCPVAAVE